MFITLEVARKAAEKQAYN